MIESLDSTVARAVFAAKRLEKAVHDAGPWSFTWGPHVIEARRIMTPDGVVFEGEFPEVCYLARFEEPLVLRCRDEIVDVRPIDWPGDVGFTVDWAIRGRLVRTS